MLNVQRFNLLRSFSIIESGHVVKHGLNSTAEQVLTKPLYSQQQSHSMKSQQLNVSIVEETPS